MYYPKSQTVPNLYTNGEEYAYATTGEEYIGVYFTTSDGKFFTGRNPNDKPNHRLIPLTGFPETKDPTLFENLPTDFYVIDDYYYYAKGVDIFSLGAPPPLPKYSFPTPTEEEYQIGEIQRYFLKKYNEISYIEIDKDNFRMYSKKSGAVNSSLYFPFTIPWVITGNRKKTFNINKSTVERTEKRPQIIGFKSYFKNRFDQLFRYSTNENLYTEGKEYRSALTGKLYQGYYHIHPEKGAMEGRQHTEVAHSLLIPVSGSNTNDKINKVETQRNNRMGGGY